MSIGPALSGLHFRLLFFDFADFVCDEQFTITPLITILDLIAKQMTPLLNWTFVCRTVSDLRLLQHDSSAGSARTAVSKRNVSASAESADIQSRRRRAVVWQ